MQRLDRARHFSFSSQKSAANREEGLTMLIDDIETCMHDVAVLKEVVVLGREGADEDGMVLRGDEGNGCEVGSHAVTAWSRCDRRGV